MTQITTHRLRSHLLTALLVGTSLTLWNCSGGNKESNGGSTEAQQSAGSGSDSSFMGRQGDTANSSGVSAPQQAPPDSADNRRRATVPAEVKVKAKQ